jgi:hypothetical protein
MEMPLFIEIEKLVIQMRITVGRSDNIKAFGEIWFYAKDETNPLMKIKGVTLRIKDFGGNSFTSVDFPAYKSGVRFLKSFVIENRSLYQDVIELFLKEYAEQSGEPVTETRSENIDPEEIPF